MHSSIMPPLSAAKEEALQIRKRRARLERGARSDNVAPIHFPTANRSHSAACVKCGDMLNLSAEALVESLKNC